MSTDFKKCRVLVVDDSQMIRDTIESYLKELGIISVDKVVNGKEALQKIQKTCRAQMPYTLTTLDMEMPEMTGLELLQAVRADAEMRALPVLFVSSKADPDTLMQIAPLQPKGFIVKPFSKEIFQEKILSLLSQS